MSDTNAKAVVAMTKKVDILVERLPSRTLHIWCDQFYHTGRTMIPVKSIEGVVSVTADYPEDRLVVKYDPRYDVDGLSEEIMVVMRESVQ